MYAHTSGAANLIPCVECGGLVSTQARVCPHCRKPSPLGTPCMLCGHPVRSTDLIRAHHLIGHHQCIKQHFVVPASATCLDCGAPLTDLQLWPIRPGESPAERVCHQCGREDPLGGVEACSFCGLLIYDFQIRVEGRLRGYAPREFDTCHVLHDFCVATGLAGAYFDYEMQARRRLRGRLSAWAMRVFMGETSDR